MNSLIFFVIHFIFSGICLAQEFQFQGVLWNGREHLDLGDKATTAACEELHILKQDCPNENIKRKDERVEFSYGELVAAADFYDTPEELNDDTYFGIVEMLSCIRSAAEHRSPENCELSNVLNRPTYLRVLSNNFRHFGWYNMLAYIRLHELALKLIATASKNSNEKSFDRALIVSAFADHFLTDAFAAGHIRVPRLHIKNWGLDALSGLLKGTRADFLSMLLHDFESRDLKSGQELGLFVRNARGDFWQTRGDGHLRLNPPQIDPAYRFPFEAVKESFKELLVAWQRGEAPSGIYQATWLVPFHQDISLEEKLSSDYQQLTTEGIIDAIYAQYPIYNQLLFSKKDFYALLKELPNIFTNFRKDIVRDINTQQEIKQRLPQTYYEAYEQVN